MIDSASPAIIRTAAVSKVEKRTSPMSCKAASSSSRVNGRSSAANAKLHTKDGWMLTGDVATLDAEGVLRVVGRVADFIIRGGKNVSGPAVEDAVASHPAVALAAAVAMPDPVYGERVCVYVELRPGESLTLDALKEHLAARGTTRERWPERLVVMDALPRASGGQPRGLRGYSARCSGPAQAQPLACVCMASS